MTIFRNAHYPQDPAFMDACDELGMFVIVTTPGWQFWNRKNPDFERRVYDDIEKMVRRDRSRPSLFMWEPILNETHFPGDFTTNAVNVVKRETLPPNNLCACDSQSQGSGVVDVQYGLRDWHPSRTAVILSPSTQRLWKRRVRRSATIRSRYISRWTAMRTLLERIRRSRVGARPLC